MLIGIDTSRMSNISPLSTKQEFVPLRNDTFLFFFLFFQI